MSQSFEILLKDFPVTGTTTEKVLPDSRVPISNNDDYFAYDQSGLNTGVVTEFNVRQFLDEEINAKIAEDFFNYLVENTTDEEFKEIYSNDRKLSDLFKMFYNTSIIGGIPSQPSFVDISLISTSSITTNDFIRYDLNDADVSESLNIPNRDSDGNVIDGGADGEFKIPANISANTKVNTTQDILVSYTSDFSYYLPINLNKTTEATTRINFKDDYAKDDVVESLDGTSSQFLKQGFVDLNINNNQNTGLEILTGGSISFESATYTVQKGVDRTFPIRLSSPSLMGLESFAVSVVGQNFNNTTQIFDYFEDRRSMVNPDWINVSATYDFFYNSTDSCPITPSSPNSTRPLEVTSQCLIREGGVLRTIKISTGTYDNYIELNYYPGSSVLYFWLGLITPNTLIGNKRIVVTILSSSVKNATLGPISQTVITLVP